MAPTIYPVMLGKDNAIMNATLTASTEDVADGFPVANLNSWRDDLPWQGTGLLEQYVQAEFPLAAPGDPWDDLSGWNETDPAGLLAVAANQLQFRGNVSNGADISRIPFSLINVVEDFVLEFEFDVTSWATAGSQLFQLMVAVDGTRNARVVVDNNGGAARATFAYDIGAGYITIGAATLIAAGTTGRIYFRRDASGTISSRMWDPTAAAWASLGSQVTTHTSWLKTVIWEIDLAFVVTGWAAGSFDVDIDQFEYAANTGINSLGISAHDIASQGVTNVRLDASVGGVGWDTLVPSFTPDYDRTLAKFFDDAPYRYYRLVLPTGYTRPPYIGILIVAPYLEIPSLPDTPHDPDETEDIGQSMINGRGHYLGSVVEGSMRRQSWNFQALTHAWVDDYWGSWLRAHSRRPFIYLWAPTERPLEAYFMWIVGKGRTQPYEGTWRKLPLNLQGVYER